MLYIRKEKHIIFTISEFISASFRIKVVHKKQNQDIYISHRMNNCTRLSISVSENNVENRHIVPLDSRNFRRI